MMNRIYWLFANSSIYKSIKQNHPTLYNFIIRNTIRKNIKVISIDTGIFLTEKLCEQLPRDYDCIIGIPRAGLIFANIISSKLGLPLSTPDDFTRNIIWSGMHNQLSKLSYKKVLLVNDDITDGIDMNNQIAKLRSFNYQLEIETLTVFANPYLRNKVDYHIATSQAGTNYEWGFIHSPLAGSLCVDLDGILCSDTDPTKPLFIPTFEIEAIVTARPESEREKTELWLKFSNVKFKHLFMLPPKVADSLQWKIEKLKEINPYWYWESDQEQATRIAHSAGIPVLCPNTLKVYR